MSTTLKALNRLEQRLSNNTRKNVSGTQDQAIRELNDRVSLLRVWHHHRSLVLVLGCIICLFLCITFISVLKRSLSPSDTIVSHHNPGDQQPSSTRQTAAFPSISESALPKENRPVPSEMSSQIRSRLSGTDRRNDKNDDQSSISEPQDKILQWYGDGLKLQAIVWSHKPSARKAFINSQMVLQGQTVDGFVLAVIGKESIVVSQGENLWRMYLGR